MESYKDSSHMLSSFTKISSTIFPDHESLTPICVTKELSSHIIIDTIRESLIDQYEYTFGVKPHTNLLESMVDGFVLYNLHKNKHMLKSKDALLKYIKDRTISIEEKDYILNIILFNQRPKFLTSDEHEYLRACGDLDGLIKMLTLN